MANEAPQFIEYKGKALVRQGDSICYGNMSDKHILSLTIMAYKKDGEYEVPAKVLIQVLSTDQSKSFADRIVKQGDKDSLFDAIDIGLIWLERANNQ